MSKKPYLRFTGSYSEYRQARMTLYDAEKHHRRSVRLKDYDYATPGAYFVTIVAHDRVDLFGTIKSGQVELSELGRTVGDEWMRTADIRTRITLDAWIVMPNHIHGIIVIGNSMNTSQGTPAVEGFGKPTSDSIPTIVRLFKSASTKRINADRGAPGAPVWQRGYYEHVIRDDRSLNRIREYIVSNPARWADDPENPAAAG